MKAKLINNQLVWSPAKDAKLVNYDFRPACSYFEHVVEHYIETESEIRVSYTVEPLEYDNSYVEKLRRKAYREELADDLDAYKRHEILGDTDKMTYYADKIAQKSNEINERYQYK